jgi:hypothetical protein
MTINNHGGYVPVVSKQVTVIDGGGGGGRNIPQQLKWAIAVAKNEFRRHLLSTKCV